MKKNHIEKKINKQKSKSIKEAIKKEKGSFKNFVAEPEIGYKIKFKIRTNKTLDESWDFRKSNTKEYTHCFHPYPAMMIPQVARRIIENYGSKTEILFDPYCGTGT